MSESNNKSRLTLIVLGFAIFCGVSQWSRNNTPLFGLVVLIGIALPLAWGKFTGNWGAMGFSKQHIQKALLWGILAGAVSSIGGLAVLPSRTIASDLDQQLLIGIPFWVLIISPFQEFFFRGWMQSGLEVRLGQWWALIIANLCFTMWHYLSPLVDMATFPLASAGGIITTFIAGLAYGYAFQRSRNIIAPLLAHTISGVVFIVVGAMDFVQII